MKRITWNEIFWVRKRRYETRQVGRRQTRKGLSRFVSKQKTRFVKTLFESNHKTWFLEQLHPEQTRETRTLKKLRFFQIDKKLKVHLFLTYDLAEALCNFRREMRLVRGQGFTPKFLATDTAGAVKAAVATEMNL